MTLTTAREIVRQFARNAAGDNSIYSDSDVDRAIQHIGDDFLSHTRCTLDTEAINLYEDDPDFAEGPDGFSPDRMVKMWIPEECVLNVVPLDFIIDKQASDPKTGLPTYLAFDSITVDNSGVQQTSGSVYPTPDDDYTLWVMWVATLTSFTAGTATPGSVYLNIADHQLRPALQYGAPAILQHNDIEHAYASASWAKYIQHRDYTKGRGSLGSRMSERTLED